MYGRTCTISENPFSELTKQNSKTESVVSVTPDTPQKNLDEQ